MLGVTLVFFLVGAILNFCSSASPSRNESFSVHMSDKLGSQSKNGSWPSLGASGGFSQEYYRKAHGFAVRVESFKNYNMKDTIALIESIEAWRAPKELAEKFPYFLSGYDYEDRPIWVIEVGKYHAKELLESRENAMEELEKYIYQAALRLLASMQSVNGTKDVNTFAIISDWEGLDMSQMTHVPTISYVMNLFQTYSEVIVSAVGLAISINVNYQIEKFIDFTRPILGSLYEDIEIYGNNKSKWLAALRKHFPSKSLPPWYGGDKDWKPLQIFG